jgi:hypothetical protein
MKIFNKLKQRKMKKVFLVFATMLLFGSCVSDFDRIENCKKKFPHGIVTPSTGILKQTGYEITVEDTITHQIYGVSYFLGSDTKIYTIVNIR